MKRFIIYLFLIFGFFAIIKAQDDNSWVNLDTVTAGRFDTGKMWTFEYPPLQYFEEECGRLNILPQNILKRSTDLNRINPGSTISGCLL